MSRILSSGRAPLGKGRGCSVGMKAVAANERPGLVAPVWRPRTRSQPATCCRVPRGVNVLQTARCDATRGAEHTDSGHAVGQTTAEPRDRWEIVSDALRRDCQASRDRRLVLQRCCEPVSLHLRSPRGGILAEIAAAGSRKRQGVGARASTMQERHHLKRRGAGCGMDVRAGLTAPCGSGRRCCRGGAPRGE